MSSGPAISMALLMGTLSGGGGLFGDEPGAYLAEVDGCKVLKGPLTVREEQDGVAGLTGTTWTVEPSGAWKVVRFRTDRDGTERLTPVRAGKLSAAEVEGLATSLAGREFSRLPATAGREAKVNAHTITIRFGEKKAILRGLPTRRGATVAEQIRKSAPEEEKGDDGVWARFAHIAEAVESRCKSPEKAP